jgi:hypothetical protein
MLYPNCFGLSRKKLITLAGLRFTSTMLDPGGGLVGPTATGGTSKWITSLSASSTISTSGGRERLRLSGTDASASISITSCSFSLPEDFRRLWWSGAVTLCKSRDGEMWRETVDLSDVFDGDSNLTEWVDIPSATSRISVLGLRDGSNKRRLTSPPLIISYPMIVRE